MGNQPTAKRVRDPQMEVVAVERPKGRGGRPSLKTPARCDAVLRAIREGHGYASAAAQIGVDTKTLFAWRSRDKKFNAECIECADFAVDIQVHALYQRGLAGDDLAALAWLRAHKPERFYRKMLEAEPVAATDPAVIAAGEASEVVHFFIPDNGRAEPEEAELPLTIEHEAPSRTGT